MDSTYTDAIATHGGSLITHLGLVDDTGTELTGGGYARVATTWTTVSGGLIRPNADKVFTVPSGATVAGWRGYSASTAGTNYGGAALTEQSFATAGEYTLLQASTAIDHNNV